LVGPEAIRERFRAQLLTGGKAATPSAVAGRLLATQAQDVRGFRLAVRARCKSPTVSALDSALGEAELVVTWLNRGTLHLVRSEDYRWLHPLLAPQQERPLARRREQLGISPTAADRAVVRITKALADGPATRSQIVELLAKGGFPSEGQSPIHLLALAAQRGLIVRGPMRGREQAYVLTHDWLDSLSPAFDRATALAELARRYLAGHGPADDRDLARWTGLSLKDCRNGLWSISTELAERNDGLLALRGQEAGGEDPPPLLLGAFEPLLLGWSGREEIVGENWPQLVRGGMISPFALVGGKAAGSWRTQGRTITMTPFAPFDPEVQKRLLADAEAIVRYLDL
jgi:winged helix DNA-binding protein